MRPWKNERNEELLKAFLEQTKSNSQIHGLDHWRNVESFGLLLAKETHADVDVVIWFAYLHDCKKTNDERDEQHGERAAEYARSIRSTFLVELTDSQIALLMEACAKHTTIRRTGNITIDTCFDADRLDLPRVGFTLMTERMATESGARYTGSSYVENCKKAEQAYIESIRIEDKLQAFYIAMKMDFPLVLRTNYYGRTLVEKGRRGDVLVMYWFIALCRGIDFKRKSQAFIFKTIHMIRDSYLADMDYRQLMLLQRALTYQSQEQGNVPELDVYLDALLLGERSLQRKYIAPQELRTEVGKSFLTNGWYSVE